MSLSTTPSRRGRPRGSARAERKLARELSDKQILIDLLETIKSINVELLRAAQSNPLIGILVTIVIADILFRLGILSVVAYVAILGTIGILEIGKVTSDILSDITKIFDFFGGSGPPPSSALEPSATTIVNTTTVSGSQGAIEGLLESVKNARKTQ